MKLGDDMTRSTYERKQLLATIWKMEAGRPVGKLLYPPGTDGSGLGQRTRTRGKKGDPSQEYLEGKQIIFESDDSEVRQPSLQADRGLSVETCL